MTLAQDFEDFVKLLNKHQVDYMIVGVKFEDAYQNKLLVDVDGIQVKYIGLKDFIKNKTASGRSQDIADLKEIKRLNWK
jgi:hypothetical protein